MARHRDGDGEGEPPTARVPQGTPTEAGDGGPRGTHAGEGSPDPELPGADRERAAAIDAALAEEDAYWARLHEAGFYETVEQLRNAVDRLDWRAIRAQKEAARDAALRPSRAIPSTLGVHRGRSLRQVNVKLCEPDFEALKALAIQRDVPPATMARMLIRGAIAEAAARGPGASGP